MNSSIFTKWILRSSVAALAILPAGGAFAQAAPGAQASAGDQLEEVVVTARKREEVIQKTPVSITAFTSKQLEYQQVTGINDIQQQAPSLLIQKAAAGASQGIYYDIRGQVETTTGVSDDASVGLYIDDVFSGGRLIARAMPLVDLERVEILKGPQGTLYGRNTTGGAVKFITKQPTYDFEGNVTLGLGNYDRHYAEGMINVPIIQDKMALRIVGLYDHHSGYSYDTINKHDLDALDDFGVRAALRFDPTDDLNMILRGSYANGRDDGAYNKSVYLAPGYSNSLVNVEVSTGLLPLSTAQQSVLGNAAARAAVAAAEPQARALYAAQRALPRDRGVEQLGWSPANKGYDVNGSFTVAYDLDPVTIKSITGWERAVDKRDFNTGGSPWVFLGSDTQSSNNQLTQEIQVTGTGLDDRLKYTAGLYYYYQSAMDNRDSYTLPNFLGPLGFVPKKADTHDNYSIQSPAAYAQATYSLTPSVNFTAGVRWTTESKDIVAQGYNTSLAGVVTCAAPLPSTAATPLAQCPVKGATSDRNVSYTFGLDWSVNDDLLLYIKTSRGFKSGGYGSFVPGGVTLPNYAYNPEIVTDYEAGVKSQWLDNRLRANLSVYHSDYNNIQRTVTKILNGLPITPVLNAANATIDGGEFEAEVVPVTGLRLTASASYTQTAYLHYTQANTNLVVFPTGIQDLSSELFQNQPKWTFSLAAGYDYPTEVGNLHTELDWYYRTKADLYPPDGVPGTNFLQPGNIPVTAPDSDRFQGGYGLLNASVSLDLDQYNSTITLWGKNILDQQYYVANVSLLNSGIAPTQVFYGDPATFGVNATYHFGGPATTETAASTYTPPPVQAPAPAMAPKSYLVFFDFNKSDLTSDAERIVDTAAKNAGPAKVTQIEVTGHTDTVGSDAYNMRLSRRRAESVAAELEKDGIPSSEIAIFAKGKRDLLVPTGDGVKEPQNRRVQIVYGGGANS